MTSKKADAGIYLHIPFCHARCGYCDFVTFTGKEDRIDSYVQRLNREIELYGAQAKPAISTIFFGGGTPSLLEAKQLDSLMNKLRQNNQISSDAEITIEANPESVTPALAREWLRVGINRVSLGLQAMDDALLKSMGRLHDVAQFLVAYRAIRAAGFDNVSVDLIYGLPGQTEKSWQETVRQASDLDPEHLSLYSLTVESGTPYAAAGVTIDNDLQARCYEWARRYLRERGLAQYEIANFSRPGKECRHNLIYWRQQNYWGFGVGAVGCVDGLRWQNHKVLLPYEKAVDAGTLPRASEERLDDKTRRFEQLMLGLRLREGMEWESEWNAEWSAERDRLSHRGLLEEVRGRWRIPDAHVALTNQVLLPFL